MLGAYAAYDPNDPNFAIRFLFDWERWDAYAFPIILAVLTWVGDILVVSAPHLYACQIDIQL